MACEGAQCSLEDELISWRGDCKFLEKKLSDLAAEKNQLKADLRHANSLMEFYRDWVRDAGYPMIEE